MRPTLNATRSGAIYFLPALSTSTLTTLTDEVPPPYSAQPHSSVGRSSVWDGMVEAAHGALNAESARSLSPVPALSPLQAAVLSPASPATPDARLCAAGAAFVPLDDEPHQRNEQALMRCAQYGATPALRSQAVKALGTTASVGAIDALIVLTRCAETATRHHAKVALSNENIAKLASHTAPAAREPDAVDRCLRDLVLYAPTCCDAPSFALDVLARRAETRHDSVCQALAYIIELHTGVLGMRAYALLQGRINGAGASWLPYTEQLNRSVQPALAYTLACMDDA